ncbi:MAG TPA: ABC transporter ATP-binding protein [Bacteroidia bacterium]|jgi:phospholipid/cholesterol/gamma-HCH transport system ATP-binding protein|nr:ABC transporter ATP-binding protein [Bacteroidia bacterium]
MAEKVVEIEHLKKTFGKNQVLKDINCKIEKGQNLVVFGKSGSGKSVLIKCLVGLMEADDGKVVLFGKDISELNNEELNKLRKKVGFLFQSAALYDSMTVRENLEFHLREARSRSKEEIETEVREALKHVGLEDAIDKMPSELSGGMRKRVGLARALILKPEIILYDEPTTGLDPITSKEISRLILDVQKKYNTASIIITHDVECARITANHMLILKEGTFVAEGTFKELEASADEWISSFFK